MRNLNVASFEHPSPTLGGLSSGIPLSDPAGQAVTPSRGKGWSVCLSLCLHGRGDVLLFFPSDERGLVIRRAD